MSSGLCRIAAATCAFVVASCTLAAAQETGLAESLHTSRSEGGKVCLADHFHYGSSKSQPSRKAAEADAISAWASFTDFEYGASWADFRLAGSRGMKCSESGGSWSCDVEARPCKRGASARKR